MNNQVVYTSSKSLEQAVKESAHRLLRKCHRASSVAVAVKEDTRLLLTSKSAFLFAFLFGIFIERGLRAGNSHASIPATIGRSALTVQALASLWGDIRKASAGRRREAATESGDPSV